MAPRPVNTAATTGSNNSNSVALDGVAPSGVAVRSEMAGISTREEPNSE